MRRLLRLRVCVPVVVAGTIVLGTAAAATAAILPVTAQLTVAVGTLPPVVLSSSPAAGVSAGIGGAATLPAGALTGLLQTAVSPPLFGLIDGLGVAAPGLTGSLAGAAPASNGALDFDGSQGSMGLDASAYLLADGNIVVGIPLAVVGVGGAQTFQVGGVTGTIEANPYQLGMVTVTGSLGGAHTIVGTGVDERTAGGAGTLVLVSPTMVRLGELGSLASIAALTLTYVPEPGGLLLLGLGVAALAAGGRRRAA